MFLHAPDRPRADAPRDSRARVAHRRGSRRRRGDPPLGARESGTGWLCIDMACSIALVEPFLGRAVLEGSCLYLALEESVATVRERIRTRLGGREDVPVHVLPLDGSTEERFTLDDGRALQGLIELIQEIQPVAIFIDPLREAHSGREDVSDDMAPRLRPIRQIAHHFGVINVVTHHQGKASSTFRGSTAIRAAFDDEIAFTRTDEAQERDIRGTLTIEGRSAPKEVIHVAFEAGTARWTATDAPAEFVVPHLRERLLGVLDEANVWLTAQEITERLPGVKLKTVQNQLTRMKQDQPPPMAISGPAKRGAPTRFASLNRRLEFVPDGSGNDVGNDGNDHWSSPWGPLPGPLLVTPVGTPESFVWALRSFCPVGPSLPGGRWTISWLSSTAAPLGSVRHLPAMARLSRSVTRIGRFSEPRWAPHTRGRRGTGTHIVRIATDCDSSQ